MEKMDFRKLTSVERYVFRKRGLSLIKSGKKQKEVAKLLGIREATVSDWVKQISRTW